MEEIVKIALDNEMDLILTHKRTMKLAELCGLTMPAQTTLATAVSEIARASISLGKNSYMTLNIHTINTSKKELAAVLYDRVDLSKVNSEAFTYAQRLMGMLTVTEQGGWFIVRINYKINFGGLITKAKIDSFREYFDNEPPLSAYDEIRKKNIQLIQLTEKLADSEKRFRDLVKQAPVAMVIYKGPASVIEVINKKALAIWGRKEEEVLGKSLFDLYPELIDQGVQKVHQAVIKTGQATAEIEKYIILKSPKTIASYFNLAYEPYFDYEGKTIGLIVVAIEVSEQVQARKKIEDLVEIRTKELTEQKKELERSNKELAAFSYVSSHDLKEPIRKIKTFVRLIAKNEQLTPKGKDYFTRLSDAADYMQNLINALLNYSSVNNTTSTLERLDLNALLLQVKNNLREIIEEKNAVIRATSLPVIMAIPHQLDQLLSNLVSNSLKYAKEGLAPVITIAADRVEGKNIDSDKAANIPYWCISVKDNGIGFEQKHADKIFEVFQRLHDRSAYTGTGIGLAICKKIAENHEGFITASGSLNEGAEFLLYIPVIHEA